MKVRRMNLFQLDSNFLTRLILVFARVPLLLLSVYAHAQAVDPNQYFLDNINSTCPLCVSVGDDILQAYSNQCPDVEVTLISLIEEVDVNYALLITTAAQSGMNSSQYQAALRRVDCSRRAQ
jgi:hypothetical protein